MKKRSTISTLLVISILIISLVSASSSNDFWNKITGRVVDNETETTNATEIESCPTIIGWRIENDECIENSGCDYDDSTYDYYNTEEECIGQLESEPETCPASITISFDKSTYNVGEQFETTMKVFDSQGNPIPNYPFYVRMYDNMWHSPGQERTGADGYVKRTGTVQNLPSGITKVIFNAYTEETSSCSKVEDTTEIEIIYEEEAEPELEPTQPAGESETAPTTCAASIKVTFDKELYYIGDTAKIVIGVFDSQGNPIPNYVFNNQMYDGIWHTPGSEKTGSDGYFRTQPTVEKEQTTLGEIKFKVYTAESSNCNSVQNIAEIEVREKGEESELVPCGMGSCIPVEDEEKKPVNIPDEKVFYSCTGCEVEDKCYPIGYRKEGEYCSDNNEFIDQIKSECDNNFECKSNICISGECVSEGLMKRIIKWFKKLFGDDKEQEKPGLEMCSKLLIEKDIGNNDYTESAYGPNKNTQVPLHLEDGTNIATIKCCLAEYSTGRVLVCPFNSKEDVRNSLRWILGGGEAGSYDLEEYKEEKVLDINDGGILAWTSNAYLIASGGKPEANDKFVEDIANAYLKKYPSSFDITADDIPYVEPKPLVFCTPEDDEKVIECKKSGGDLQSDGHPDKECEVYVGCVE